LGDKIRKESVTKVKICRELPTRLSILIIGDVTLIKIQTEQHENSQLMNVVFCIKGLYVEALCAPSDTYLIQSTWDILNKDLRKIYIKRKCVVV